MVHLGWRAALKAKIPCARKTNCLKAVHFTALTFLLDSLTAGDQPA